MKARIASYQDLEVWKLGIELAKSIYVATQLLPKYETYALGDQLRRAAVSIPTNIAEGYQRNHRKEYTHYLAIAAGSQAELTTLLILAKEIHGLPAIDPLVEECASLGRMLTKLRQSLETSPYPKPQTLTPQP